MRTFFTRLIFIIFFVCSWCFAQTFTGSLEGRVADTQGAVIQNAGVAARNMANNVVRRTTSATDGRFRIDGLEAGEYQITTTAPQFSDLQTRVVVRVSEVTSLTLRLHIAGSPESVDVRDSALDRSSNVISNPITEREIHETPLANRSFANIAYLAPQTAPVEPSDPTKARTTAVSFAGSSGLNVDLSVDGGDDNDDYIGGFLQNYTPEAIREFNVRTAQFDPDTSRSNGGSIVISTLSGTNDWHTGVSGFFRTEVFNARNRLDNPQPNPKQPYSKQD